MNTATLRTGSNFDALPWNDDGGTVFHQRGSHFVLLCCCREDPGTPIGLDELDNAIVALQNMKEALHD